MRRALIREGFDFRLVEPSAVPSEAGGATAVRVLRTGICGTDLQIARRVRADPAAILGHEGVGEVLSPAWDGSRYVIFNPVSSTDQDRILGHTYDGLLQTDIEVAADLAADGLVPALAGLPLDLACLVEPLGTAVYAWEIVGSVTDCRKITVFGAGTAGLLTALLAAVSGAEVEVVHRRQERVEFLRHSGFGRAWPVSFSTRPRPHQSADCAFICVPREGAQEALDAALGSLADGGVIDLFGGFGPGDRHRDLDHVDLGEVRRSNVCGVPRPPVVLPVSATGRNIHVTGHRGSTPAHLTRAQELLATHAEAFSPLITRVVSLARAGTMLSTAASGGRLLPGEFIKAVVDLELPGDRDRPVDLDRSVPA